MKKNGCYSGDSAKGFDIYSFPIIHGGEELGTMMVSSRSHDEVFPKRIYG